jgi:hypothetical protein
MPTAKITVQVEKFNPVGSGLCTIKPLVITDNANGRVSIDPANILNLKIRGRGRLELDFVVEPSADYAVAGVAFDRGGLDESGGSNNFSLGKIENNVLSVANHYKKGSGAKWELYIAIVKRGSTRELGIIDPGIENAEEM